MARIRINKLPEGFEVRNGNVVKAMKSGGYVTGDQHNWGLVTVPPIAAEGTEMGAMPKPNMRYTLEPVPRVKANIEAEKDETVLTDLK